MEVNLYIRLKELRVLQQEFRSTQYTDIVNLKNYHTGLHMSFDILVINQKKKM